MKAADILKQEKELSFESFTNEDAYHIALSIIERVQKEKFKHIRIRVVLHNEIVFQHLMDGKTGDIWLNRKQKTIERFQHSGYYLFLENKEHRTYQQYENDESLVLCGGSFPIIVQGKIVGCFIVSGLSHEQDHQLIVDAFYKYKNKKALASDIDGTLFFPKLETSYRPGDLKAIRKFQEEGHLFGVCTGRPLYAILDMQKDLNIDFYIVSSGSILLDKDFHMIEDHPMSKKLAQKIFEEYKNIADIIVQSGSMDKLYVTFDSIKTKKLCLIHDFKEIKEESIYSISFILESEEMASKINQQIMEKYPELSAFQNRDSIDIVKKGCSKGIAVKKMKQLLKVKQIAGIGDSFNDLPLLKDADIGFTFHSSPKVVQDKATYIVDSIEEAIDILMEEKV